MSATTSRLLAGVFLVLLFGRGYVLAQQPESKPGGAANPFGGNPAAGTPAPDKLTLEELLARALKEHPDIRVAEAKLKEADAELSRARVVVAQKVISFHASLVSARHQVEEAEAALARVRRLSDAKAISQEEVRSIELALVQKKAELARLEAELPLLLGSISGKVEATSGPPTGVVIGSDMGLGTLRNLPLVGQVFVVDGTVADKIRKALDTPIQIKFQDATVAQILDDFKQILGVSILDLLPREARDQKVSLALSERVPAGAALQALSDLTGLKFAVREYGILVTKGDLPPGAMPLHSFWKSAPATGSPKPGSETKP